MEVEWFPAWSILTPLAFGFVFGRWWSLPLAVASVLLLAFAVWPDDGGEGQVDISIGYVVAVVLWGAFLYVAIPVFWATVGVGLHRGVRQVWLRWGSSRR